MTRSEHRKRELTSDWTKWRALRWETYGQERQLLNLLEEGLARVAWAEAKSSKSIHEGEPLILVRNISAR